MDPGEWTLSACGISHKSSSLEERERFQLTADEIPRADALALGVSGVRECVVVSTCNRIEFYLVSQPETDPLDVVAACYRQLKGLEPVRRLFRTRDGRAAADHLFHVAAGLDSMVLGENQILGQVKDAYSSACAVGSAGKVLHRLFHQSFRIGKQVRTDTEIGRGACSVSSAALELLGGALDSIDRPTVLLIGVNKMTRIAATRLARRGGCRLLFANRTAARAVELAAGFGGAGFGLDRLPQLLAEADVTISCTSSPVPIVTTATLAPVRRAVNAPRRRVIMDLAVPRDVDIPKCWSPDVEVLDLEDVRRFVEKRQQERELEIPTAEGMIAHRLDDFARWCRRVVDAPVVGGGAVQVQSALHRWK